MSDVRNHVERVLREHARRIDPNRPGYGNCRCGFVVEMPQEHAEHVAEAVVAALGQPTITTVEQLDALPEGAVIHVPHKLTASSVEYRHGRWWPNCAAGPYHHGFRDELLPALLLWVPVGEQEES